MQNVPIKLTELLASHYRSVWSGVVMIKHYTPPLGQSYSCYLANHTEKPLQTFITGLEVIGFFLVNSCATNAAWYFMCATDFKSIFLAKITSK